MATTRRKFIRTLGTSGSLLFGLPALADATQVQTLLSKVRVTANDKVRIALIGSGIIGHYDTAAAMKVPGVELVAVCDLYQGRLDRAKEKWGNHLFVTRNYKEILARKDIDAVLVCTCDHWHDHITIDALKAGKHVYCEKPMVHHVDEGQAVVAAQKASGKVLQIGSQSASSLVFLEAQKYFKQGLIGDVTYAEAFTDRNSANGAWLYTIPNDASPKTIDWDMFLGDAPKLPFDPVRFFHWRNYKAYGTGVAGDLFVHSFTGLHTITSSLGPKQVYALGALNYWKDGRDAYDIVTGISQYPKTENHNAFQFFTRVNLADGAGGGSSTRLIGTEGVIDLRGNTITIKHFKRPVAPGIGGYDSMESFPKAMQEQLLKEYDQKYSADDRKTKWADEIVFEAPKGYDSRLDHMINFFESVRTGKPTLEDGSFGLRAAAPALICNLSAEKKKAIDWDPVTMKLV
ncbi:Gfo/Idh/MocA family protein [Sediminibacterium soli]|uniref:Gfo/Idh/MocA family protein n=1 Tax=Sediminibacterium soli TaxID=2698829 RepID=UPI00137A88FE|nr:Gfo/Idh/MocA family oxidoreductase [Sediminibacterium soli]NCI47112.1 Gfo/Idh/MocA family oxidoreductase [Sediminibacterium soli]